jgi:hypothetical protein
MRGADLSELGEYLRFKVGDFLQKHQSRRVRLAESLTVLEQLQ